MPRLYLTDLAIRRLKPTGKQVIYWDTASPVALRMSQAGGRSFIVVLGEKRRKVSLGKYPEQISLAEARIRGARLTQECAYGAANVASMTFEEALEGYFRWSEQHHRTSTSYQKRGLFRRHFEERFGRKQLTAISLREVTNVLDGLSRTPSEARHAYIAIRAFLSWCCARQYLARSPCETLLPPARVGIRERVLDDAELACVYKCASELGQFGRIVRLCIVTAQRRGEIGALKWSYIDPGQRFILFPGSAVKNGKAHSLPLTEMADACCRGRKVHLTYSLVGMTRVGRTMAGARMSNGFGGPLASVTGVFTTSGGLPLRGWLGSDARHMSSNASSTIHLRG